MFRRAQGWFSGSRRRRRRLAWTAALAIVGGSVASIVVFVHEGGQSYSAGPARKGPAQVYKAPRTMRVTRRSLRSAEATVVAFLRTAVLREHVADSFDLVTPAFRRGYTRDQWSKGEIPVVPYPLDLTKVRYNIDYSYLSDRVGGPRRLGFELYAAPKRGEKVARMVFAVELQAPGRGPVRHWLISYWEPKGTPGAEPPPQPSPASARPPEAAKLSKIWLLIPALALGGVVLVPLAFLLLSMLRASRIRRSYNSRT